MHGSIVVMSYSYSHIFLCSPRLRLIDLGIGCCQKGEREGGREGERGVGEREIGSRQYGGPRESTNESHVAESSCGGIASPSNPPLTFMHVLDRCAAMLTSPHQTVNCNYGGGGGGDGDDVLFHLCVQLDMKINALADVMKRQNGLIPGMAPSTSRDHTEAMLYANTQNILFVRKPNPCPHTLLCSPL